ncbi:MAG: cyclophilin-like fold protein [Nostoc sp. DedQUE05]|uniref:cyclophilin-like fold protein n=1 Tax=Nostoc sp. DedQUE05 TaxID=3075391 RepID=UPI002AD2C574|nr:cyclophilin-like fold protein [Nostoc sp. DedQUE05]MDZ8090841.1 cyclophilin-like fold protein [Nostoc sp. DedQUE05]
MLLRWFFIKGKNCQQRMLILVLALAMSLNYSACRADNNITSSASLKMPTEISTKQADSMKINIKVKDKVVTATLIDSKTTEDFISLLPLTLTLEDYATTEKISDLPKRLSTEDAPPGSDPAVGDIAYYAPWGNLAMFYRDSGYANGLVILGKIDGGIEAFNVPGSVEVTIELVQS